VRTPITAGQLTVGSCSRRTTRILRRDGDSLGLRGIRDRGLRLTLARVFFRKLVGVSDDHSPLPVLQPVDLRTAQYAVIRTTFFRPLHVFEVHRAREILAYHSENVFDSAAARADTSTRPVQPLGHCLGPALEPPEGAHDDRVVRARPQGLERLGLALDKLI
jgi:hypothetical protein